MSEPTRWLKSDKISPELRDLLRTAPQPSALPGSVRRRVLTRVSTLAPLVTVFGLSLKAAATTFVASAVVSSAAIVGVHEWQAAVNDERTKSNEPPKARPQSMRPPAHIEMAASPVAEFEPIVEESSSSQADQKNLDLPSARAARTQPSSDARVAVPGVTAKPSRNRLEREAALLERARAALQSAPGAALTAAQQHASSFPSGQLRAERMFIEADALRRLGRTREARRTAEQALEQYPDGLYAERVRRFLGELRE